MQTDQIIFKNETALTAHILEFHEFKKCSSSISPKKEKDNIVETVCLPKLHVKKEVHENRSPKEEKDYRMEQLCSYACDICDEALGNPESLETHFKIVHKCKVPYSCNTCFQRYENEEILNQHKQYCNGGKL